MFILFLGGLVLSSALLVPVISPPPPRWSSLWVLHSNSDDFTSGSAAWARLVVQTCNNFEKRYDRRMEQFTGALSSFKYDLASDLRRLEDKVDSLEKKVDADTKRLEGKVDGLEKKVDAAIRRLQTVGLVIVVVLIVTSEELRVSGASLFKLISGM